MSLPTNKINKVKLSDNNTYEIIPTRLKSGSYEISVPTITADDTLTTQSILSEEITELETYTSYGETDTTVGNAYVAAADNTTTTVSVSGNNITITSDTVSVSGNNITFTSYSTFADGNNIYL